MKIFNVFKPHIVQFQNGNYGIRRLSLFGFEFLVNERYDGGVKWWNTDYSYPMKTYCIYNSEEEAKVRLTNFEPDRSQYNIIKIL